MLDVRETDGEQADRGESGEGGSREGVVGAIQRS